MGPFASDFTFLTNRKYSSVGSSEPNAWLMGPRSAVGFGAVLATFSLLLIAAWYGSDAAFRYLEPLPLARTAVFTRLGARESLRRESARSRLEAALPNMDARRADI